MTDRLAELSAQGVAVWLDDLSRVRLTTGSLEKLRVDQHVVGVTTNPSIFFSEPLVSRTRERSSSQTATPWAESSASRSVMVQHSLNYRSCDR